MSKKKYLAPRLVSLCLNRRQFLPEADLQQAALQPKLK